MASLDPAVHAKLAAVVGPNGVMTDLETTARFTTDWTGRFVGAAPAIRGEAFLKVSGGGNAPVLVLPDADHQAFFRLHPPIGATLPEDEEAMRKLYETYAPDRLNLAGPKQTLPPFPRGT